MNRTTLRMLGSDKSDVQQAYKNLRTNLTFLAPEAHVIAITSSRRGEGKTTVATGLAKSLSEIRKKTLLVDADFRHSIMASHTNPASNSGLVRVLEGHANWKECIQSTQCPHLDILTTTAKTAAPQELLSMTAFPPFMEEVREQYDYVIIDTPAVETALDAAIIGALCDGVLVVVATDCGVTHKEVKTTVTELEKRGSKVIGLTQNDTGSLRKGKKSLGYK
mgnify:CR=1 FL=1